MARGPKPEEQGPGAPLWMVSFTDSMTNLLTFFILLITFSAFGDYGGGTSLGVGPRTAGPTVFSRSNPARSALLPYPEDPAPQPIEGSEKPNPMQPLTDLDHPRKPIGILDAEAYSDRKVVYIPSRLLFYGWGSFVTETGEQRLAEIGRFLRATPCQVVIAESSNLHPNHPLFARPNVGLARAYALIQYFTEKERLAPDRFSLCASAAVSRDQFNEEPVVELVMLTRRVYP